MAKKYRIVLFGMNVDEGVFRQNMARLGVSSTVVKDYIERAPVVLIRDLSLADARRYAEAVIDAGGVVNIQETGEFPETRQSFKKKRIPSQEEFIICHNCGLKQKKGDRCARCGCDFSTPPL